MNTTQRAALLLFCCLFSACQSGWVPIDGVESSASGLEQARQSCRIDEKLAALEQAKAANSIEATEAGSNEARMAKIDEFGVLRSEVYLEIDRCMQAEGYRRP